MLPSTSLRTGIACLQTYRVILEDGRVVNLYRALGGGRWHRQSY